MLTVNSLLIRVSPGFAYYVPDAYNDFCFCISISQSFRKNQIARHCCFHQSLRILFHSSNLTPRRLEGSYYYFSFVFQLFWITLSHHRYTSWCNWLLNQYILFKLLLLSTSTYLFVILQLLVIIYFLSFLKILTINTNIYFPDLIRFNVGINDLNRISLQTILCFRYVRIEN